ncbi:RrF2 family transcriptional regulator [Olsenella urininfantis]|uniref:RrF2 family transcriptional regulator n=1 Tax=Olsenella urininfantis TaxID=1871033 RepID=UPI0009862885|nr:Rrf2 family transcriptional regulator [Olsenella urininfantis]
MDISRKTDYALRMLSELVRNDGAVISVRTAADRTSVPYSFARSIQHDLAHAGIIESTRGSRGGMRLVVDPKTTTVVEVVEAMQGPIAVSNCGSAGEDGGPCPLRPECHFNPIWCEAERLLRRYFSSVSLYEVVMEHKHPVLEKGNGFVLVGPHDLEREG